MHHRFQSIQTNLQASDTEERPPLLVENIAQNHSYQTASSRKTAFQSAKSAHEALLYLVPTEKCEIECSLFRTIHSVLLAALTQCNGFVYPPFDTRKHELIQFLYGILPECKL